MSHSRIRGSELYQVGHVWLFSTLFLILGLASLRQVAVAADRADPQINRQLQRSQDIPLERLERPLRTPPDPIKPVNLNTASIEELVALPDINAALAQQIIGCPPYHAKTDLLEKHILPDAAYDRGKNFITVE